MCYKKKNVFILEQPNCETGYAHLKKTVYTEACLYKSHSAKY